LALQALLELVLMGRLVPLEQLELVIPAQRVLQAQVLLAPLAPLVQELLVLLGLVLMAQPARRAPLEQLAWEPLGPPELRAAMELRVQPGQRVPQASAEQQVLAAQQGQPALTVQAVPLEPAEQSV
jgi:hypothetical protein